MRILVATGHTQRWRRDDYHWCVEGELVWISAERRGFRPVRGGVSRDHGGSLPKPVSKGGGATLRICMNNESTLAQPPRAAQDR